MLGSNNWGGFIFAMSYECKLVSDDTTSASKVMKKVEGSGACVRVQQPGDLYLKDQSLRCAYQSDVHGKRRKK
ncbi:hypothetical protein [Pseudomonas monsensis]